MKTLRIYSVLPAPLEYRYHEYLAAKENGMHFTLFIGDDASSIKATRSRFQNVWQVYNCRVSKILSFKYQNQTIPNFIFGSYDFFFIQAHFKYIDFWIICFINLILRRKLIVHGQGLYRYRKPGLLRMLAYFIVIRSCCKYVCYNEYCMLDLKAKIPKTIRQDKVFYVNNIIRVNNQNIQLRQNVDILFIGRLREQTRANEFLKVFSRSDQTRQFHVIGDGPQLLALQEQYASDSRIIFYGGLTDHLEINAIAEKCSFGVYPGNSGLSLVHYAALGLIPIFHNNLWDHMGPECGYFQDYLDDVSFDKDNLESILHRIEEIERSGRTLELRNNMLELYNSITLESFGEKFGCMLKK